MTTPKTSAELLREWLDENYSITKCVERPGNATLALICEKLLDAAEFYEAKKHVIFAEEINWSEPEGYSMYDVNYIEDGLTARKAIEECLKEIK